MGKNGEFYFSDKYDIESSILCNENDSLFIPGTVDEAFNNNNFVLGVISFKNKASLSTQCTTILKSSTKVETPQIYIVDP